MDGISQAELKHGRIAMLAFVGLVVPEFVRIPGRRRVDVGHQALFRRPLESMKMEPPSKWRKPEF